jgi:hypothetical protein
MKQLIKYFCLELKQIGHEKIAFILLLGLKPAQKNQFGILSKIYLNT